eukprot:tig00020556_g11013.t1
MSSSGTPAKKKIKHDAGEPMAKSDEEFQEMSDDDGQALDSDDDAGFAFVEEPTLSRPKEKALTEDDIIRTQQNEIEKVAEVLSVTKSVAGALLRHFRWDQERVLSKCFEDGAEKVVADLGLTVEEGEDVVAGPSGVVDGDPICGVCFDSEVSIRNPCGHGFCDACWKQFLTIKIDEGEKAITCAAFKCKARVPDSTIEKAVEPSTYQKYKSFLARSFVDDNPNAKWCPAANCGRAINNPPNKSAVKCDCGHTFCFHCMNESHAPARCHDVKLWYQKCKDDSETYNWLSANTQDCPQCKSAIEKNGGCNHMTCKKCKFEFCWVCQGEWKQHTDYYSCNRYDKSKPDDKATSKERSKAALERYLHYYHRYLNHENSLKMEAQLREKGEEKMRQIQENCATQTWIDVQYIKKALDQLLQCRHVLKYTYVFAYYLNDPQEKSLFEYLQDELEKTTESLSGKLEEETDKFVKADILNLTRLAAVRLKHLLDGVETGLTKDAPASAFA